jgi:hypothetical protein
MQCRKTILIKWRIGGSFWRPTYFGAGTYGSSGETFCEVFPKIHPQKIEKVRNFRILSSEL